MYREKNSGTIPHVMNFWYITARNMLQTMVASRMNPSRRFSRITPNKLDPIGTPVSLHDWYIVIITLNATPAHKSTKNPRNGCL